MSAIKDAVHRFLFEQLDIRGALVQLGPAWQAMHSRRNYATPVRDLLGELAAVAVLITGHLKTPGRITFQVQGKGPITLLVMDCDQQLRLRGMAHIDGSASALALSEDTSVSALLGHGQLVMTLHADHGNPYQSIVPLAGDSLSVVFEHYLTQSEQQPARLWLAANNETACGLFLQKLPEADQRDSDGWERIAALASTVSKNELTLSPETLLTRLFTEEDVRLFEPRPAIWHCPRDEEKIREVLRSLGREELESILADAQEIAVDDEICGHEYRFGPELLDELFPPGGRVLH